VHTLFNGSSLKLNHYIPNIFIIYYYPIKIEKYTTFKSTDFNSKELDEQHHSPISVRNLMSKNLTLTPIQHKQDKPNKIKNTILYLLFKFKNKLKIFLSKNK
jgi:hypothetical protein